MTPGVRTDLPGDPASVEALAGWLEGTLRPAVAASVDASRRTRVGLRSEWRGRAAERAHGVADALARLAADTEDALADAVTALRDFAATLRHCQQLLARLVGQARLDGLVVHPGGVTAPPGLEERLRVLAEQVDAVVREAHAAADALGERLARWEATPWLMAVPGGAAEAVTSWPRRAVMADGRPPGVPRLTPGAARTLRATTGPALVPASMWLDHACGEPWDQAIASQAVGAGAGWASGAVVGAAVGSMGGPPGAVLGAVAGTVAGVLGAKAGNDATDRVFDAVRGGKPRACGAGERKDGREKRSFYGATHTITLER